MVLSSDTPLSLEERVDVVAAATDFQDSATEVVGWNPPDPFAPFSSSLLPPFSP